MKPSHRVFDPLHTLPNRYLLLAGADGMGTRAQICEIHVAQRGKGGHIFADGVMELLSDGYGFLGSNDDNQPPRPDETYASPPQIGKLILKSGRSISFRVR